MAEMGDCVCARQRGSETRAEEAFQTLVERMDGEFMRCS